MKAEDAHARNVARDAANPSTPATSFKPTSEHSLAQVKGQIATFVDQAEAAAAAASSSTLNSAQPVAGFPAPPPDSRANIAIRTAETTSASPMSGAARAARASTARAHHARVRRGGHLLAPLLGRDVRDDRASAALATSSRATCLFYGYDGDQHVAMYVGHGIMIEAPETGEVVHITPIRLGYGFAGLGRPRA